ncbi:hypothetical protein F2P45_32170 [Massilia sp. CCM 8733]|uniref:Uncharacterized protein n=1 Tax=Massilia mucilaginosa TaxID=2609282 RepID=A0ABX0P477_9BURK|nr:hypothetical protein [Massilia mucilaginosa]NHZ93620.1 hypothetical protein [Massilia mucilaginosa]
MNLADNPGLGSVDRAPYQLAHLLRRLPADFSAYQPFPDADCATAELVARHARNANETLMHGLAALGHVMMLAGLNEEGQAASSHLARMGDLITHLAVEAETMQELDLSISNALKAQPRSAGETQCWVPALPGQLPPPEQIVIGWHTELESPVVIFYDSSGIGEPCWRVCADGGQFVSDPSTPGCSGSHAAG